MTATNADDDDDDDDTFGGANRDFFVCNLFSSVRCKLSATFKLTCCCQGAVPA